MGTKETARLRMALAGSERGGRGRAYPVELRREVVRHARARVTEGESVTRVAVALGLRAATLASWLAREGSATETFTRVALIAEPASRGGALVVHGPGGLRIEGLDLDALATLLRRLG